MRGTHKKCSIAGSSSRVTIPGRRGDDAAAAASSAGRAGTHADLQGEVRKAAWEAGRTNSGSSGVAGTPRFVGTVLVVFLHFL